MKDKVFIIWSGDKGVANHVKTILENDYNYVCYVGGCVENGKQMLSVGDTVINQMLYCNQAIVIFQNKSEGQVSNNLFFELGFVISNYGMRKVHCVKHAGERIELPSDFDNAFVTGITATNDKEFADRIVDYFLERQKLSIVTDKMELITNRHKMHDNIQAHYSDAGSRCSDYELAQYILFYMQAAVMFQDDSKVLDELIDFKKRNKTKFSKEISQAIAISIALLRIQVNLISENGVVYIDDDVFRTFFKNTKDLFGEIENDDSGLFDKWAKVILTENISYASSLYSQNPNLNSKMQQYATDGTIKYGGMCINLIEELVRANSKVDNNDETGLIAVFRAYVSRHLYTAYIQTDIEKTREWLNVSLKEWKMLLNNFGDNSIDTKLFENFEMEYYLTLVDYLRLDSNSIDEFEKVMFLADIDEYIQRHEKKNQIHSYVKKIIEGRNIDSVPEQTLQEA